MTVATTQLQKVKQSLKQGEKWRSAQLTMIFASPHAGEVGTPTTSRGPWVRPLTEPRTVCGSVEPHQVPPGRIQRDIKYMTVCCPHTLTHGGDPLMNKATSQGVKTSTGRVGAAHQAILPWLQKPAQNGLAMETQGLAAAYLRWTKVLMVKQYHVPTLCYYWNHTPLWDAGDTQRDRVIQH